MRKSTFYANPYKFAIYRVTLTTLFLALTQILFLLFNNSIFPERPLQETLLIFVGNLHFSLMAATCLLFPFILLVLLPHPWQNKRWYTTLYNSYYYAISTLIFLANLIDVIFYRFTFRRMTADIFDYLGIGGDFDKLLPQFLKDFWYMALLFVLFMILFVWLATRIKIKVNRAPKDRGFYLKHSAYFLLAVCLSGITVYGRIGTHPMRIIDAGIYTAPENIPLVVNTPFSIIRTWHKEAVAPVSYFKSEKDLEAVYTPVKHYPVKEIQAPPNIVIIILESFSSEYIGSISGKKSYTPFLDSLIRESLAYRGLAAGKRSIDGIPAVMAGMPLLMRDAYITSPYAKNTLNAIPGLLKEQGYRTLFFHGGSNGTMGFDVFCKAAGIDQYYGRNEYNNEKDYDGNWGIFDEPFLQYMAKTLTKEQNKPFCATVFTLSSHHPYTIPEKYQHTFDKGELPIHPTIAYTDMALKAFFETAAKTDWYANTLFVITADHTAQSKELYYENSLGMYEIPIIFYHPGTTLTGCPDKFIQQTDIMPSVLQYAGYSKPFISFGESVFDSTATHFHITCMNDEYQLVKGDYMIIFDGEKICRMYNIKKDPLLKHSIKGEHPAIEQEMLHFMQAIIQQYNNRIRENRLHL